VDYVDRFACDWHRLSTTDPKNSTRPIIELFFKKGKQIFTFQLKKSA